MFLLSPFFTALIIPTALIFCGAVAKKLVSAKPWSRRDFYFGVELSLAALSSGLIRIFEISQNLTPSSQVPLISTTLFIVATLLLFFFVLVLHQQWESKKNKRRSQIIWLCIISNLIGGGLIATFVILRGAQ